jgi:hypothetical protein
VDDDDTDDDKSLDEGSIKSGSIVRLFCLRATLGVVHISSLHCK